MKPAHIQYVTSIQQDGGSLDSTWNGVMLQIPKRRSGIVLGVNLDFRLLTRTAYVSHKKFFNPFATENDGAALQSNRARELRVS